MNNGKRFEQNFKNSVLKDVLFYRFKDGTSAWEKSEKTRFQAKNVCDCMVFNGKTLFLIELKQHKGKSLPFQAIRENQLTEMQAYSHFKNVKSLLIVFFTDSEQCFALDINTVNEFIKTADRKSIPISFCEENGERIHCHKKKVNYSYELDLLKEN